MQTEQPYWIHEAYSSPLSATDTGLIARPMRFSRIAEQVIMEWFDPSGAFLDYGGGNGVFVRMMRDKGFDFYRYDKFAENIYAIGFDMSNVQGRTDTFELLTSIEVVEHFEHPLEEMASMFSLSDTILFTTFLNDNLTKDELKEWWYLGEYNGQHISFYSAKSLHIIAERHGAAYYTNGIDTHLFSRKRIDRADFVRMCRAPDNTIQSKLADVITMISSRIFGPAKVPPQSFTEKDSEYVKKLVMERHAISATDKE
ncbi:MAG TPA: class I SAM-dependent methyltransferase [Desulfuromonadaceae bacterium]